MSARAKIRASIAAGKKLAKAEISVLGMGLMSCMPRRANMAALPNPKADTTAKPMASI
jgi:hypothetical protein